ncbi:MAG: hypothetical protein JSW67_08855 [Candidatus Latescibacterota bacterium]|nr:MAG: hypothetical protein JSW67_08855 [Candidatus Latescibacterota bacterium]
MKLVLHPFFFAGFPVLFLYARNATQLSFAVVWLPLVVTLATAGALLLLLRWRLDAAKSGVLVTWAALLFFSYGHAARAFRNRDIDFLNLGVDGATLPLWFLLLSIGTILVLRTRRELWSVTRVLNIVGVTLVGLQIATVAYAHVTRQRTASREAETVAARPLLADLPDIYFIVLDGYGRADVLQRIYGLNNSRFLATLRELGFQVLEESRSNYCQTLLSLAATMNLDYIQHLLDVDPTSKDKRPAARLLRDNRLVEQLKGLGYTFVAFESGYEYTEFPGADHYLQPGRSLSEFENILVATTPLALAMRLGKSQYDLHRERLDFILSKLPNVTEGRSPRFVFVHLVAPHPPFVFGPKGEPVSRQRSFDFSDGSFYYQTGGTRGEYVGKFRNQTIYITSRVEESVRQLLARTADDPPVVVLQSDHGPGSQLDWFNLPKTNHLERFGILNAIHMPGHSTQIDARLSPVNTFRLLLNAYCGETLKPLEDRSYFTVFTRPYYYYDVTRPDSLSPWPGDIDLRIRTPPRR